MFFKQSERPADSLKTAKKGDVAIVRTENGKERRYKFNYNEVVRGKNVEQNIRLLPGDTSSFANPLAVAVGVTLVFAAGRRRPSDGDSPAVCLARRRNDAGRTRED